MYILLGSPSFTCYSSGLLNTLVYHTRPLILIWFKWYWLLRWIYSIFLYLNYYIDSSYIYQNHFWFFQAFPTRGYILTSYKYYHYNICIKSIIELVLQVYNFFIGYLMPNQLLRSLWDGCPAIWHDTPYCAVMHVTLVMNLQVQHSTLVLAALGALAI